MANITMSIDDGLLKVARKIAVEHDTTLSDIFRKALTDLARQEDTRRNFVAEELDKLFGESEGNSAGAKWTRDELYDR